MTINAPSPAAAEAPLDPAGMLDLIVTSLDGDKAIEIVTIDLAGKSAMADYLVVASGTSDRQVKAMADHIMEKLHKRGVGKLKLEGLPAADWVLLDAGDVIVHLFQPEVRSFYQLEKLWGFDVPATPA